MLSPYDSFDTAVLNFLTNKKALYAQYPDGFIILHDTQILGPYKTITEVYREAFKWYKIGTFVV